jgi:tetratricopeptide (TPR) repeat protein
MAALASASGGARALPADPVSAPPSTPSPAPAAGEHTAAALLRAGNKAFKEGRFAEAERAYREALAIKPGYDIAGNLGAAELAQGKLREAAAHLAFTLRLFPITGDPALRDQMQRALDQARRGVGAVEVKLDLAGATVRVDGEIVGEAPLLDALYVDPGEHTISASLPGYRGAEQRIRVDGGGAAVVTLALTRLPPPVVARAPVAPRRRSLVPGLALGGAAVASLAGGALFLGLSAGQRSDAAALSASILGAHRSCVASAANYDSIRCPTLLRTLDTDDALHDVAVGAFIVSGAAAAGAAAYFLWPERRLPRAGRRIQVTPVVGSGDGRVIVSGSF